MDTREQKDANMKIHCTAFCPKCGSDLYFVDKECICKKKGCNWHCGGCAED